MGALGAHGAWAARGEPLATLPMGCTFSQHLSFAHFSSPGLQTSRERVLENSGQLNKMPF